MNASLIHAYTTRTFLFQVKGDVDVTIARVSIDALPSLHVHAHYAECSGLCLRIVAYMFWGTGRKCQSIQTLSSDTCLSSRSCGRELGVGASMLQNRCFMFSPIWCVPLCIFARSGGDSRKACIEAFCMLMM
jgi:hypothetical protein